MANSIFPQFSATPARSSCGSKRLRIFVEPLPSLHRLAPVPLGGRSIFMTTRPLLRPMPCALRMRQRDRLDLVVLDHQGAVHGDE